MAEVNHRVKCTFEHGKAKIWVETLEKKVEWNKKGNKIFTLMYKHIEL